MKSLPDDVLALSIADLAVRLGLSERTVHRLIRTGELPSIKIGRRRLVPIDKFKLWLSGKAA